MFENKIKHEKNIIKTSVEEEYHRPCETFS
jgi:hypothetical protein